jgi:hypothetical protein
MVIQSVSKHSAQELHGNSGAAKARPVTACSEQETRTLNLQAPQTEISSESEANSTLNWIRSQIAHNFRAVVAIQGNLDPLRVAQLVEA